MKQEPNFLKETYDKLVAEYKRTRRKVGFTYETLEQGYKAALKEWYEERIKPLIGMTDDEREKFDRLVEKKRKKQSKKKRQ